MTTDEEIIKLFRKEIEDLPELLNPIQEEAAAIRLWRVAEKETTERIIKGWKPLLAEARASEREKCDKEHAEILMNEMKPRLDKLEATIDLLIKAKEEAYAKGASRYPEWLEAQIPSIQRANAFLQEKPSVQLDRERRNLRISTTHFEPAGSKARQYSAEYCRGQADLIGKLTSKEAVEAACEYWYGESELTDADTWQEVGKTTQDDYREMFKEIIEKAIKKASSISSEIGEKPPRKAAVSESADGHERGDGSVGSAPSLAAKGSFAPENAKEKEGNDELR
jgi:hypothetical protein